MEILIKVLQLVLQQQRLTKFTLVSHAWHAAATAATSSITMSWRATSNRPVLLQRWLHKYSRGLRSITAQGNRTCGVHIGEAILLPLEQLGGLQSLDVSRLTIWNSSTPSRGTLAGLTALTALRLYRSDVNADTTGSISALINLRRLQMQMLDVSPEQQYWQELATSLPQLTHLALHMTRQERDNGPVGTPSLTSLQQVSDQL